MQKKESRIRALVEFCSVPRSRVEMMDHIGVVNVNGFKTNYLDPMQAQGLIRKTVPEKPSYRYQKYIRCDE